MALDGRRPRALEPDRRPRLSAHHAAGGDLQDPRNLLLREAPVGDFEISTLVRFAPTSNFQFAGLVVYQDRTSHMQYGRAFADCGNPDTCPGNAIYFDSTQNGEAGNSNYATVVESSSTAYLRLRREGTTYGGYYSEDGVDWILTGRHTSAIEPLYVGLIAGQAYEAETTADFDYFVIEELP